jgi:hypothetical protein|tara:strand:- start:27 stop:449 length:423 start_codon:yes stop_codon:yes gene_type:complete
VEKQNINGCKMKIIKTIFGGGADKLVETVGGVLDNLSTSKEEKLEAKRKIKELMVNHQVEVEKNVSERWKADMNSDSWLSKNVRPLVLVFTIACTMLLVFIDSGSITFQVEEKWTDLLQLTLITIIGAYFGGRSVEKLKK